MINVYSNYCSCDTRKEAIKVQSIITEVSGYVPEIFKDGNMYRVQHDLGDFKMSQILLNS